MAKKKTGKKWQRVLKRIILLLLLLAVLGVGGWIAYDQLKAEYTTTYDSYTASIGTISNSLSFSGSLQLVDSATYSAQASTSVRTVYVEEGQTVKKGDKLMRLADGESFTADFDGKVNRVYVKKDDDVNAGTQLVQIADFTHLTISFRVDEYDISEVSVGQACRITTTATEKTFESKIASIDYISASNGNVAYYTARCYVDVDDGVYPGMQATVTVPQEEATNVVVLKMDALSFDEKNSAFVYMKDSNDEMEKTEVTVGVSNGNYVEITSGLKEGDTVYVEAKKTETQSGLTSMMSGLFGGTQVNTPPSGFSGSGSFGSGSGGPPSGFSGSGSFGGSGSSGSSGGSGNRPSGGPGGGF